MGVRALCQCLIEKEGDHMDDSDIYKMQAEWTARLNAVKADVSEKIAEVDKHLAIVSTLLATTMTIGGFVLLVKLFRS